MDESIPIRYFVESEPAGQEGWIAVTEKLPQQGVWVLVLTTPNKLQHCLRLVDNRWRSQLIEAEDDLFSIGLRMDHVTHWRELSAPPASVASNNQAESQEDNHDNEV